MENNDERALLNYVRQRDWTRAIEFVDATGSQEELRSLATASDPRTGCTPIDFGCVNVSPHEEHFVAALLSRMLSIVSVRNANAVIPLNHAILRSSVAVVRMLLKAMLQSGLQTENGPDATKLVACRSINHHTGVAKNRRMNALTLLCTCNHKKMRQACRLIETGESTLASIAANTLRDESRDLNNDFFERLTLVLKAFYHRSIADTFLSDGKAFRLLHACCGIEHCPPSLLQLAIVGNRDQIKEMDEDGNMPIHVAASASFDKHTCESPLCCCSTFKINDAAVAARTERRCGTLKTTMQILVDAKPDLAKEPNQDGKLPLHLAIESGREWDEGVDTLVNAHPALLAVQDQNGLFPFMLAAAENTSPLTVVYKLFRMNPETKIYDTSVAIVEESVAPPPFKRLKRHSP